MSISAAQENAKTLGRVIGLDDDEAAQLLCMNIPVRSGTDPCSELVRRHTVEMLARMVSGSDDLRPAAQIVVGTGMLVASGAAVRVGITRGFITISCERNVPHDPSANVPEILLLIAACYAAAMAVRIGVGSGFSLPYQNTISLPVDDLLRGRGDAVRRPISIGRAHLAGAGAIGNGFLWALATMDIHGELHVVDPKLVSSGNLGRCVWFAADDVGRPKAERLVARAGGALPGLRLFPHAVRLQEVDGRTNGAWLRRLVVAVDSRRARRGLQDELPLEVFDASTTGVEEIVVHFNSALNRAACLSCVYAEDVVEDAHERHVAEVLGVEVSDVRHHYIGEDAARRILARHPDLGDGSLVGIAFDSLFKSLCATGRLGVDEGRTILAPFSFVSVLAGAFLALELALRVSTGSVAHPFNYWRASPWTSPVVELQVVRPARLQCETCGDTTIRATIERLWGADEQDATR